MDKLNKYIGCDFNENTKSKIEQEFNLYKVTMCDLGDFYLENFWENQIRCVVINGKIDKIQFN